MLLSSYLKGRPQAPQETPREVASIVLGVEEGVGESTVVPEQEVAVGAEGPLRQAAAMRLHTSGKTSLLHQSCFHNSGKKRPCHSPLIKCLSLCFWKPDAYLHHQLEHSAE